MCERVREQREEVLEQRLLRLRESRRVQEDERNVYALADLHRLAAAAPLNMGAPSRKRLVSKTASLLATNTQDSKAVLPTTLDVLLLRS